MVLSIKLLLRNKQAHTQHVLLFILGGKVIIEDVFYVPDMKCNLMSICQLVEKGFSVSMEGKSLQLFDSKKNLVLKSTLSKNRTYRCNISSDKMMCMSATISEDAEALWHLRYGHLNFRSLSELSSKDLVHGLPKLNVKKSICEICVKSNQSRLQFVSDAPKRASEALQVVHSDICGLLRYLLLVVVSTSLLLLMNSQE